MKIRQHRVFYADTYTISKISIDGRYFCDAVEDTDRGLHSNMSEIEILQRKIKNQTAIPYGTYAVTIDTVSPRFAKRAVYARIQGKPPRLLNVPGFDGVLVHIGNSPLETSGCVLVGKNTEKGRVTNSSATFFALYAQMQKAKIKGEEIIWEITGKNHNDKQAL